MITKTYVLLALIATVLFTSCSQQSTPATSLIDANTIQNSNILGGELADTDFQKAHGIVLLVIQTVEDGKEQQSICTGSLITHDIVLTAAHCVDSLGLQYVAALFTTNAFQQVADENVRFAVNFVYHDKYNNAEQGVWNDIAVLKLDSPAPADYELAVLPTAETIKNLTVGSALTFSGYGITTPVLREFKRDENGQVIIGEDGYPEIVEFPTEGSGILRLVGNIVVTDITADHKEISFDQSNLKGACHGDSGGPALLQLQDGSYIQVGVTSRGTNFLGNCNEGAIYTGVYGQLEWIESAVNLMNQPVPAQPVAEVPPQVAVGQ